MKRISHLVLIFILVITTASCSLLDVRSGTDPDRIQMDGLIDAHLSVQKIQPYEGKLVSLGLFEGVRGDGEFVSLDIWPLGGVGVGVVGARVHVLIFEFAIGTLFYSPTPKVQPVKEIIVTAVEEQSQAQAVGIKVGDRIVFYNGQKIKSSRELIHYIESSGEVDGAVIYIKVARNKHGLFDGEQLTFEVKPGRLGISITEVSK